MSSLQIVYKKIDDLTPYVNNAKRHSSYQINAIVNSIKEFGFINPIIIDKNNNIIAGHGRFLALKKLGIKEVPTLPVSHLTPAQVRAYRIADNKLTEIGEWDEDLLKVEINLLKEEDFDLEILGLTEEELQKMIDDLSEEDFFDGGDEEEEVEEVDFGAEAFSRKGDLWILGRHKLLCGDSTKKKDLDLLLGKEKVDSLITDPPYGVDYSAKNDFLNKFDKGNRIQTDILNDNISDYRKWFSLWLSNARRVVNEYNTFYIFMSGKEIHNLILAINDVGGYKSSDLIWVKNNHVLGRQDYNPKHEIILYGWFGKHKFYGDFSTTVLEFDKPLKSELHPTMKPVPLLQKLIIDGSPLDGIILDLFGGSGSTLIASEKTKRSARLIELSEHYVDVIVRRYISFTNDAENIKLLRDGEIYSYYDIQKDFERDKKGVA